MTLPESYNTLTLQECTDQSITTQTHKQHIHINNKYTIHALLTQQIHKTNT